VPKTDTAPEWRVLVASRLSDARRRSRLTLRDVADQTGLTMQAINQAEHARHLPSLAAALRLAILYGVSLDWLCGRGEG
jgi:transcriptional regulator with XRE-family HTH domain